MSAARRELVDHISRRRYEAGLSDAEFASAVGISLEELRAFEAAEVPLAADVLAAMLGVVATTGERDAGSGFREDGAPPLQTSAGDRFAQSVQLLRDFAAITSDGDRQEVMSLAAACAARAQG